MYRPRIQSVCNCSAHLFPVRMRYAGQQWRNGRLVHVLYCPVSGVERYYIYQRYHYRWQIRRVA